MLIYYPSCFDRNNKPQRKKEKEWKIYDFLRASFGIARYRFQSEWQKKLKRNFHKSCGEWSAKSDDVIEVNRSQETSGRRLCYEKLFIELLGLTFHYSTKTSSSWWSSKTKSITPVTLRVEQTLFLTAQTSPAPPPPQLKSDKSMIALHASNHLEAHFAPARQYDKPLRYKYEFNEKRSEHRWEKK